MKTYCKYSKASKQGSESEADQPITGLIHLVFLHKLQDLQFWRQKHHDKPALL